jgi:hypothetical protein
MNIEIFALCDAATESAGKVNILGAFDTLAAREAPVTVAHCAVALRARFKRIESGEHKLRLAMIDADGKAVIPAFQTSMNIRLQPGQDSAVANMILNLQQVKLTAFGRYAVDLAVDGREAGSLPFYVRPLTPNPAPERKQP